MAAPHVLPGDALALACAYVGSTVSSCVVALRATCPAARVTADLARALAAHLRLELPRSAPRKTRAATSDPFALLVAAERRRRAARDDDAWALWISFHVNDCAARVAKALAADPALATHAMASFEHRTLLFCAAWRGRSRCVKRLLAAGADADAADARGCTPLIVAAWANREAVVRSLLRHRGAGGVDGAVSLGAEGEPPQTSSCGNRGAATAVAWAHRKNLHHIELLCTQEAMRRDETARQEAAAGAGPSAAGPGSSRPTSRRRRV